MLSKLDYQDNWCLHLQVFFLEKFDSMVLLTRGGKRQHHDMEMPNVTCVMQVWATECLIK